jgi:hypothetical protein
MKIKFKIWKSRRFPSLNFMDNFRPLKFFSLFFLAFVLAGCQAAGLDGGLKALDENIGKAFNNFQGGEQSSVLDLFNKKESAGTSTAAAKLTVAQKNSIDDWLAKKGLNKYGDASNAIYTGGTPLFDEKTGQAIERYDYILNKFPGILESIKNDK